MNAIRLHTAHGPAGLVFEQVEMPQLGAEEVQVHVYAAAITRDELDWPVNRLPAIPCYEFSGEVAEVGSNVEDFEIGDEVYALSPFDRDGAAAEYIVIHKNFLAPKPKTLDHIQSASIPLAALTAWQGLFEHGQLQKGQQVLIHGATGGVGHFAVQLASQRGATVIGTVSTGNIASARNIGVDQVIDIATTRFEHVVHDVDLVFDTVGGDRLVRSPSVLRRGGRLISVATEPPGDAGASFGIDCLYFVVSPNRQQLLEITKQVEDGVLQPRVDAVFPLSRGREAFERSLVHHRVGKIVLRVLDE